MKVFDIRPKAGRIKINTGAAASLRMRPPIPGQRLVPPLADGHDLRDDLRGMIGAKRRRAQ